MYKSVQEIQIPVSLLNGKRNKFCETESKMIGRDYMALVGEEMKDILVQKAYRILEKRGYGYPMYTCYFVLLRILEREGEESLMKYAKTVEI